MHIIYPKISVIGAGNGGQAIAGYCASLGISVCLYNRNIERLCSIITTRKIRLEGALTSIATLDVITDSIQEAINFGDIILIVTTASAHRDLAEKMCPYLRNGQIIILNPGRTCGVLEFGSVLARRSELQIYLAEAQTLIYACREVAPGIVNIIGVKKRVMLSGRNKAETDYIISVIHSIFPCFIPAKNLMQTGLDNIGAILHPPVILFNAATIERNIPFYFYRDMTPNVASVIQSLDNERLNIGKAFGVELISVSDWIVYAYPTTIGRDLCERMRNNPAYYDILGPGSVFTRQLTEDIPTGLVPMSELAHAAHVETPLMDSLITISSSLLNINFREIGRTLQNLNLSRLDKQSIIELLS